MPRNSKVLFHTVLTLIAFSVWGAISAADAAESYDPKPWLEDFDQVRTALLTKYSDLEWVVFDREIKLGEVLDQTKNRIATAKSGDDARTALVQSGIPKAAQTLSELP